MKEGVNTLEIGRGSKPLTFQQFLKEVQISVFAPRARA